MQELLQKARQMSQEKKEKETGGPKKIHQVSAIRIRHESNI